MAEKSPRVQPTRHRKVLTPARRHVGLADQKSRERTDGGGGGGGDASLDLLQQDDGRELANGVDTDKADWKAGVFGRLNANLASYGCRRESRPAKQSLCWIMSLASRRIGAFAGGSRVKPFFPAAVPDHVRWKDAAAPVLGAHNGTVLWLSHGIKRSSASTRVPPPPRRLPSRFGITDCCGHFRSFLAPSRIRGTNRSATCFSQRQRIQTDMPPSPI